MVDIIVYRGNIRVNARRQSSNKISLDREGDTEYRETSERRLSHIYIYRGPSELVQSSL